MKKPTKITKPSKTKTAAQKRTKQPNPILDLLKNMDEEVVAMLRRTIQAEMGLGSEMDAPEDPEVLFAEYLDACTQADVDEDEKGELMADLAAALDELKISANGGHREAREKIQAVYDLLDDAIDNHKLHMVDLTMTAKIFADAGWDVPDSLKQAVAEALQTAPSGTGGVAGHDLVSALLETAGLAGQNPFDVHGHLNSLVAGFPPGASVMLLSELIAGKQAVIDQAAAGFALHPDSVIARSVVGALAASAAQTPVASAMIERLVRMRPWLPQARQAQLDATIRAMRLNALPPVKTETPRIVKCYLSVCDGLGARSLFVTQRAVARYQIATVMMKRDGVADALLLEELPKSGMDDMVRQLKASAPTMETDLAGVGRMLELAIADNFASGKLPPFKLVEIAESLGLGPLHPDPASPGEIIAGLLVDLPPEQTNPLAAAKAHADVLGDEFEDQWFEAGEALENLLYPVKGFKRRVAKLIKDYLPERRLFWARQCALSALALRGDKTARQPLWKRLALVGRDIASDMPLDQIPLMKQVAEISVRAFESSL
jgi:hypothetical protein